ncbi:hypothetical protein [Cognataquiflexum rubidum]|uniref:hypothetical protein n=1 Tax=Cognataquiflexum rubidum TaxID=2922273 RepID=UPI001F1487C9|nr:hypothetical protein [Cognataquiflexum rubidum]MCH6236035.1 hypothetical protein [Cognataquiflexum rubidum]
MESNKIGKGTIISQVPIPIEEYSDLLPHFKIKSYRKNTILKEIHEIETQRRYLISGTLALFERLGKKTKCRRIYSKYTLVFDFESYTQERLTNYCIKAYADCLICEIPREIELRIMESPESMIKLILRLSQQLVLQNWEWSSILWLPPKERYKQLPQICPDFALIKIKDISGILNLPERTIYRLRRTR